MLGHRVIVVARVQNIYTCIIFASLDLTIFKHLGTHQLNLKFDFLTIALNIDLTNKVKLEGIFNKKVN